ACDVTDREAVHRILADIPEDAPLTTVIHAAGAPGGVPLEAMGPDDLVRTLAAKVDGARVLDDLLRDKPLDAFVLYSSNAGVWGSGSQGGYAAANAYLDALAAHRRARGEPATSVAWGLWAGDGMGEAADAMYWQRRGIRPMDVDRALRELERALEHDETFVAVADVDWAKFTSAFTVSRPSSLLKDIPEARKALAAPDDAAGTVPPGGDASVRSGQPPALAALAALPAGERERGLLDLVRTHTAAVLGHTAADRVGENRSFTELGFDSLIAVQLRNRLSTAVGAKLPATLVYDYPTPAELAAHLHREYVAGAAEPAPSDWEGQVRHALAALPLDRLRDAGILDVILRLTGLGPRPTPDGDAPDVSGEGGIGDEAEPTPSIDDLDSDALVRMALGTSQS
ncbi:beta-ketoacyl reductase, partial [Streptomyces sp. NPDC052020]|uniref:beta-ketoacyl reductase n=1 Tax=Streptomyces sp. NPDC052020 TaxID=3155677 RepID=UPI003439A172